MGYYSCFEVTKKSGDIITDEEYQSLCILSEGYQFDNACDTALGLSDAKWYEYIDHIRLLSIQFPKDIWTVDRTTEDDQQVRLYAYKGIIEMVDIISYYPDPDYTKLGFIEVTNLGTTKTLDISI